MAGKVKRTSTKHTGVYFNESTKKYDIKYNYKIYNPLTKKNDYKSKWVYNLVTITEARAELARLQTGETKVEDKDITLEGAHELWKIKALTSPKKFSPVTVNNTQEYMNMIYQFVPKDTKLKNITEEVYYKFCSDCREHKYSDETLHSLNATFRKLINLAYKKRLLKENILDFVDNLRTEKKNSDDYRLITKDEFDEIDKYFHNNSFWRLGVNNYPKYRLLFNILYYCGLRIGETIALTYADFEEFDYHSKNDDKSIRIVPSSDNTNDKHLRGMRIRINKAYVSDIKLTKDTKNYVKRTVPLSPAPERLFMRIRSEHIADGGSINDKIFNWTHGACDSMIGNACKKLNFREYNCHEFRHTFISNLIKKNVPLPVVEKVSGDTQATILKTYSHMFESDEVMILTALQDL